jgi:hypothetical protein
MICERAKIVKNRRIYFQESYHCDMCVGLLKAAEKIKFKLDAIDIEHVI